MRRFIYSAISLILLFSIFYIGCGDSNYFGGSFDIAGIHALNDSNECDDTLVYTDPGISVSANATFIVCLKFVNNMSYEGGGQTVRIEGMTVEYLASNGETIVPRTEQIATNVEPGETLIHPVTLISYEQYDDIASRWNDFPETPFQVSCEISVDYDTSGGQEGSVSRLFTIQIFD